MLVVSAPGAQLLYRLNAPLARDAFRTGVEAYYRGRYADSLLAFERVLAFSGADPLSLFWLGKAYYRMGLTATAFDRWRESIELDASNPFIQARLELLEAMNEPVKPGLATRYVRVAELAGHAKPNYYFSRPSWIEPRPDGSVILVGHGSNELLLIDANAVIRNRFQGSPSGFDRPFACLVLDSGTMFVSEFQADRIAMVSENGRIVGYAEASTGIYRISGPQYLAADGDGFIYVTMAGSAQVMKFSPDGRAVLGFGMRGPAFDGLVMPTGIAVLNDRIYVADGHARAIFMFDPYGNFLGKVPSAKLERPEGLQAIHDGLLVADGTRVIFIDPETGSITSLFRSESRASRILSAVLDANGDLLMADFNASELIYASDPQVRYAGLAVDVIRVNSDTYPAITLDVRVQDRNGRPLSGLGIGNFYVSERIKTIQRRTEGDKTLDYVLESISPARGFSFEGSLDASPRIDSIILVEGSLDMHALRFDARDALSDFYATLGSDATAGLILAGAVPQPAVGGGLGPMSARLVNFTPSQSWRFDSGLRLAAGNLGQTQGRRLLVYLSTGLLTDRSLDGPSLAEMASLLSLNGISFNVILVGMNPVSPVFSYLASSTGGQILRLGQPEGFGAIVKTIRSKPSGMYRIGFQSSGFDGFGLEYLPINVEVYLRDRSGKDECGFFAPVR